MLPCKGLNTTYQLLRKDPLNMMARVTFLLGLQGLHVIMAWKIEMDWIGT